MSGVRRALLLTLTACLGLIAAPMASLATPVPSPTPSATATPTKVAAAPKAPTLAELAAADAARRAQERVTAAAAHRVTQLAASIAAESKHLAVLSTTASLAEQQYTAQQSVQAKAEITEMMAQLRVTATRDQYRVAHQALVAIAVSAYQSDSAPGSLSTSSLASLLTVGDPSTVLGKATEQNMLGDHQATVVTQTALAMQAMRSAEHAQQASLADVTSQGIRLDSICREADAALAAARSTLADLQVNLRKAKATQKQADAALSTFLGGWSLADPVRAAALNHQYQALRISAAHAKPAPRSAHWTAAMGRTAVTRALQYLGTPYAWAGGNAAGPTHGLCVGGSAKNDCHVTGFDCSGLALYGWALYLPMAHLAATQYSYGAVHPALAALLPGDLVFWSSDHTVAGIHHVAIYLGEGNVIQAPQSGDIVRITPLANVSSGYFGATRPMSSAVPAARASG